MNVLVLLALHVEPQGPHVLLFIHALLCLHMLFGGRLSFAELRGMITDFMAAVADDILLSNLVK